MSVIDINSARVSRTEQPTGPQAVERKRKTLKHHTVPGTITAQMRAAILSEIRGGRSAVQVGKAYNVAVDVVLELMIRALDVQMREIRRAA